MTEPSEAVNQVWLWFSIFPYGKAVPTGTRQGGKPFPQRTLHSLPQADPLCPHYWLAVLFVLLISNLNFLPLLLIFLLTMDLENKLYLLQQIILFSKITLQDNVDAMSSGSISILLLSRK